jgi:hypothetical protein
VCQRVSPVRFGGGSANGLEKLGFGFPSLIAGIVIRSDEYRGYSDKEDRQRAYRVFEFIFATPGSME